MITDDEHDCAEFGDKAEQVERKVMNCSRKWKRQADKYKFYNRCLLIFIGFVAVVKLAAEISQ